MNDVRVLSKSKVVLVCRLTGSPASNFGWTLGNGSTLPSNAQVVYTVGGTVATLTVNRAARNDMFLCSASNRLGKVEGARKLIAGTEKNTHVVHSRIFSLVPLSVSILPAIVQIVNFGESAQFHVEISPIVSGIFVSWRLLDGDRLPSYVSVSGTMNETISIMSAQETISFAVTVTSENVLTLTSSSTLEVRPGKI